ncbi:hypothetical protein EYF80_031122 [Liparis tanakae]|uniref:Uncharacterized protein n=1 Tax=Liparis tanakae TaxID=230148 RepID=A0A4Z2GYM1_9TELE|nr:hypothetical protein EYF80_031122 [Liparis tanakae]
MAEAQSHCRENYKDLATIRDLEDLKNLRNLKTLKRMINSRVQQYVLGPQQCGVGSQRGESLLLEEEEEEALLLGAKRSSSVL